MAANSDGTNVLLGSVNRDGSNVPSGSANSPEISQVFYQALRSNGSVRRWLKCAIGHC